MKNKPLNKAILLTLSSISIASFVATNISSCSKQLDDKEPDKPISPGDSAEVDKKVNEINSSDIKINPSIKPNPNINSVKKNNISNFVSNFPKSENGIDVTIKSFDKDTNIGSVSISFTVKKGEVSKDTKAKVILGFDTTFEYNPHLSDTLPIINFNVDKKSLNSNKEYHQATIDLTDEDGMKKSSLGAQVKVRGNSTSELLKKPYRIKFNEKQSMFDLNNGKSYKNWVLLAEWVDASMTRNQSMLLLSQYLFKSQGLQANDFRLVELHMNGEYHGLYVLTEQNEVNEGRVNINEASKEYQGTDIGYLIEMDNYAEQEIELERFQINYNNNAPLSQWRGANNNTYDIFNSNSGAGGDGEVLTNWYAIKSQINNMNQNNFIKKYLDNLYTLLYKAIIGNEYWEFNADKSDIVKVDDQSKYKSEKDYLETILNIDSAISALILQEIACDYDVSNSSFYMSVDLSPKGDKKLTFNVPWDFDNALGNRKFPTLKLEKEKTLYAANSMNPWLVLLYHSKTIRDGIVDKWEQMKRENVFEGIYKFIDLISQKYVKQFDKNYEKWKNIGKYSSILKPYMDEWEAQNSIEYESYSWMFYQIREKAALDCQNQAQASTYLKTWLKDRLDILDSIWRKK